MNRYYYTALGDSLTSGLAASIFDGFAYKLYRYLKKKYKCLIFNNLGQSGITSCGLLMKLRNNSSVRCIVKKSDIITISIGGNNLLKAACNNYCKINERAAERGIERFAEDWPQIMNCIRSEIGSQAYICVMTLYNPYCINDKNYKIADFYINEINSIILNPIYLNSYNYAVADIYSHFKNNHYGSWTLFNRIIRSPHPTEAGNYQIADIFKNCLPDNPYY